MLFVSLRKSYNLDDYPRALSYYEQALKISREIWDREGERANLIGIGYAYQRLGDYPRALFYHRQALKIVREIGDRQGEGKVLNNIGNVHQALGGYLEALSYYEQALRIHREVGDREEEGGALGNIGVVYGNLGDYPRALSYCEQALRIGREIRNRKGEEIALGNIGNIYLWLGDYSQALSYYEQALRVQREIKVPTLITEAHTGDIYLEQGKLKDALAVFQRLGSPVWLGKYYLWTGDYQRARQEFVRSLRVGEKRRGAELLLLGYIGLGLALEGLGDYAEARAFYQEAVEFVEQQREALTEPQRRGFFATKVRGFSRLEPYEGLVRVSSHLEDADENFFWAENTRARLLLEVMANRSAGALPGISEELSRQETDLINRIAST